MDEDGAFCSTGVPLDLGWSRDKPDQYYGTGSVDVGTIAEVAREFGLTLRTLRFYEAKGLLAPQRNGAVRLYDRRQRERIAAIVKAKRLGFTLVEIRQMLGAPDHAADSRALDMTRRQCVEQIRLLEDRKREIEAALAELRRTYSSFYARLP